MIAKNTPGWDFSRFFVVWDFWPIVGESKTVHKHRNILFKLNSLCVFSEHMYKTYVCVSLDGL